MLARLAHRLGPGDTLAVLPEGVLYNYLLRTRNPTRHISFLPFELSLTGEQQVVTDFAANPPELVLLNVHSSSTFGLRQAGDQAICCRLIR